MAHARTITAVDPLDNVAGVRYIGDMNTTEREREIRKEAAAYRRFATRHHKEHIERNPDCLKCKKEALHQWARKEGLM